MYGSLNRYLPQGLHNRQHSILCYGRFGFYADHRVTAVTDTDSGGYCADGIGAFIDGIFLPLGTGVAGNGYTVCADLGSESTASGADDTYQIPIHYSTSSCTVTGPVTFSRSAAFTVIFSISPGAAFSFLATARMRSPSVTVNFTLPKGWVTRKNKEIFSSVVRMV